LPIKVSAAKVQNMINSRRVLRALSGLLFVLVVAPASPSQVLTTDHFCEGDNTRELPVCQRVWQPYVSAVFLGLAKDVQEEDVPIILDGRNEHTLRLHVTFQVEEAFLGVSEKVVKVTSGGDMCGFPFSKGHMYLVFGRRLPSGDVYVSISSATEWEKDAGDDLKYLRGLPTAPHGVTIYGTVFRYTAPENRRAMVRLGTPETGRKIEIQGTSRTYEAVVDSRGKFRISGLPPGRYTVLLNAEGEIHTSPPLKSTTVDVVDKGCAQFGFWIDPFAKKEPTISHDGGNLPPEEPHDKTQPK
jgi:hypothetical protein